MESSSILRVLMAAPAGAMSSSLRSFLYTIPRKHIIIQTPSLVETIRILNSQHPDVLILDADLALNLQEGLQQLHRAAPDLPVIVLVNNSLQHQSALEGGARHALLKGFLNDQLRQSVLTAAAH
jgi:DNA-binding NarL/FixJ family response regulator